MVRIFIFISTYCPLLTLREHVCLALQSSTRDYRLLSGWEQSPGLTWLQAKASRERAALLPYINSMKTNMSDKETNGKQILKC